jgi:hypothetical protein
MVAQPYQKRALGRTSQYSGHASGHSRKSHEMILIDGNSIAARAFFGTHYNTNVFDEQIFSSAFIKSFLNALRLVSAFDSKVIVCVDSYSWRKKIFPEYKENRNDLKSSVPYKEYQNCYADICAEMKGLLPIAVLKREPWEADDLIAYYVMRMPNNPEKFNSFNTAVIVTTDTDMHQLYRPRQVQIYNHATDTLEKVADTKELLQVLICAGGHDNIPSLSPKKDNGKPKFRFGEKTIPSYIAWGKACSLSDAFWQKLDDQEKKTFLEAYALNERLVDLSLSPIHGEELGYPDFGHYEPRNVERFFRTYMNHQYETQQREIQALMERFGG